MSIVIVPDISGAETQQMEAVPVERKAVYFDAPAHAMIAARAKRCNMTAEQYLLHVTVADAWGTWSFDGREIASDPEERGEV